GDGAADAPSGDARALDVEVVEQVGALTCVRLPRQPLDAAAGPPRLALVEGDTGEVLLELVEEAEALVDPERAPVLDRRVEAAGGEEEERRPVSAHLVVGLDPVAGRRRPQSPRT